MQAKRKSTAPQVFHGQYLTLRWRSDRPVLQIQGRFPGGDPIRENAKARSDFERAKEELIAREAQWHRAQVHGERAARKNLAAIADAYLTAEPRTEQTKKRVAKIVAALPEATYPDDIDADTIATLKKALLGRKHPRTGASTQPMPSTVNTTIMVPLKAVINFGAFNRWCGAPRLRPETVEKKTKAFCTPAEAQQLIDAAPAHLRPLLIFLFSVGARLGETLSLQWRNVDLKGRRVTFIPEKTKTGNARVAHLPPAAVAVLEALPHRLGPVFLRPYNARGGIVMGPYAEKATGGGQIEDVFERTARRAGLENLGLTPHSTRHSWASWHYALHANPLKLAEDGGWASLRMIEIYTHMMPAGHKAEILELWGYPVPQWVRDEDARIGTDQEPGYGLA